MPTGDDSTVFFIPGMPAGTVIPLGNNAAMVGTNPGDGSGQYSYGGAGITQGTGNVALAAGYPYGAGAPTPESTDPPATGTITLVNKATSAVNYTVNGNAYSMQPKYAQTLDAGTAWVAAFDRGNNQGSTQYSLTEGTYKFTITGSGWELYKQSFAVALDNRDNRNDFNFLLERESGSGSRRPEAGFPGTQSLDDSFRQQRGAGPAEAIGIGDLSSGACRRSQSRPVSSRQRDAAHWRPCARARRFGGERGSGAGQASAPRLQDLRSVGLGPRQDEELRFRRPGGVGKRTAGIAGAAPVGHPSSGFKLFDPAAAKIKTFASPSQGSAASSSNAGFAPGPVRRTSAMATTDDGNGGK